MALWFWYCDGNLEGSREPENSLELNLIKSIIKNDCNDLSNLIRFNESLIPRFFESNMIGILHTSLIIGNLAEYIFSQPGMTSYQWGVVVLSFLPSRRTGTRSWLR